jgi:hypothetical protein
MDAYVERLEVEGIIRGTTQEINQAPTVEKFGSDAKGDRKLFGQLNMHLRQIVGLKKQENVISAAFYFYIILSRISLHYVDQSLEVLFTVVMLIF